MLSIDLRGNRDLEHHAFILKNYRFLFTPVCADWHVSRRLFCSRDLASNTFHFKNDLKCKSLQFFPPTFFLCKPFVAPKQAYEVGGVWCHCLWTSSKHRLISRCGELLFFFFIYIYILFRCIALSLFSKKKLFRSYFSRYRTLMSYC